MKLPLAPLDDVTAHAVATQVLRARPPVRKWYRIHSRQARHPISSGR